MSSQEHERGSVRRRVAAIAALVLMAVTLVAMSLFVYRHLLVIIAVDILVVVGVWATWDAATTRGKRSLVSAGLAIVALVVMVLVMVASDSVPGLVLVLVLLGLSGGAAREALTGATTEPVAHVEHHVPMPLRPVLFMNPKSGGGKVGQFDLVARAEQYGAKVVVLGPGTDLVRLATAAVHGGADLLGAAGGDGTQALVAKVCADHGLPFLCIPAGTRNHFALDLGLDRDDPGLALSGLAVDAAEIVVDLAEVSGRPFVNNVSMGVYAQVIQSAEYRDDKVGTFAEMLPDLVGPDAERFDLRCETPDGPVDGPELLMVSNNPYRFASLADFGTRERIDTGRLGVLVAQVDSPSAAAQVVRLSAVGQVERYEGWRTFEATEFTVTSESGEIATGIDGEAVTVSSPAVFTIRPRALQVRLPKHRPGVKAPKPRLSGGTLTRLWDVALGTA